jgi:NAD(P)-dependent dehydrogenase (short-subunit alcohol dehydrogenase family)
VFDGRALFVTHVATILGQQVAVAIGESGADVATTANAFADRAAADAAFAATPRLDVLVHVCLDDRGLVPEALVDTTPDAWDARGEALLRDAIFTFQAAHARFAPTGTGRIVLVAPHAAFTGAAGFVPLTTAVEGVRGLAKSAARQWGPHGITVNTVLVPPALVADDLVAATTFNAPPVVGRQPVIADDVLAAISLFASSAASTTTGSTLIVDGGSVMAP